MKHTTRDGTEIDLRDMSVKHLAAYIRIMERKAKDGLCLQFGNFGICDDEPYYDSEVLYGKKALEYLNYDAYITEQFRRKQKGR